MGRKSLLTDRYSQIIQKEQGEIKDLLKEWEHENSVPLAFIETIKGCQE
jgi:hypothetical protein